MNKRRALLSAQANEPANFLITASPAATQGLGLALLLPFPVYLGINGYRVCFARVSACLSWRARSLADMARFRHVQGARMARCGGVARQRPAGDRSAEPRNHVRDGGPESRRPLLPQPARDRGRGSSPCAPERPGHRAPPLLLHYELPQYLHTHPSNRVLIGARHTWLERAYADGSLRNLCCAATSKPAIEQFQVAKRLVLELKAPPGVIHRRGRNTGWISGKQRPTWRSCPAAR